MLTEDEYVEDTIDPDSGNDWNFDQHKKIDTKPKLEDFEQTVADYINWEVTQIIKNGANLVGKP